MSYSDILLLREKHSLLDVLNLRDKHLNFLSCNKRIADRIIVTGTYLEFYIFEYNEFIKNYESGRYKFYPTYLHDMYLDDLKLSLSLDKASLGVKADLKTISGNLDTQRKYAMITVGWNEQTITATKMLTLSHNILKLKYFTTAYMVLEKHRENGIHHHTHYLVEFDMKYPVSKILGWIYQTKGVKEHCLNKSFIDYLGPQNGKKPYQTYEKYFEYISGNKKEGKLKYVEDDRKWRDENKIPHLINL